MKTLITTLLIATATAAHCTILDTFWREDSPNGFDMTMLGTGFEDTSGSLSLNIVSPSGLWDWRGSFSAHWDTGNPRFYTFYGGSPDAQLNLFSKGLLTFVPANPLFGFETQDNLENYHLLSDPIGTVQFHEYIQFGAHSPSPWEGANTLVILDIPDLNDTSTWEWVFHSAVHKRSVSDTGSTLALLGLALTTLAAYRKRS